MSDACRRHRAQIEASFEGTLDEPSRQLLFLHLRDCDACRESAPDFFKRNDERGYSFVYNQPKTEEEKALAYEALEGCPVEAIGDDGDAPA